MGWLWLARAVVAVPSLLYAAVSDWRSRDIDPRVWIAPIAAGVALDFLARWSPLDVASAVASAVVAAMALGAAFTGLVGGADALALTSIAALFPSPATVPQLLWPHRMPPIMFVLCFTGLCGLGVVASNVLHNARRAWVLDHVGALSRWERLFLMLATRLVTVDELERMRFWFPLYAPPFVKRLSFSIDEADTWEYWVPYLRAAGVQYVAAGWGVPMVTFICVGGILCALGLCP